VPFNSSFIIQRFVNLWKNLSARLHPIGRGGSVAAFCAFAKGVPLVASLQDDQFFGETPENPLVREF
jgi:hypothetical protein